MKSTELINSMIIKEDIFDSNSLDSLKVGEGTKSILRKFIFTDDKRWL